MSKLVPPLVRCPAPGAMVRAVVIFIWCYGGSARVAYFRLRQVKRTSGSVPVRRRNSGTARRRRRLAVYFIRNDNLIFVSTLGWGATLFLLYISLGLVNTDHFKQLQKTLIEVFWFGEVGVNFVFQKTRQIAVFDE